MAQPHEAVDPLQLDLEAQRVAERAVGVGEGPEQVGVLVVGAGHDDLTGPGEDLHLADRLVRQAVAEGRGLDPEPGDRPAEGDGLELRDDQRHRPDRQGRVDEPFVGGHPLHLGDQPLGVDRQDVVELADVQAGHVETLAGAEEVGGALGQPDRLTRRNPPVVGLQPLPRRAVTCKTYRVGHPHPPPLSDLVPRLWWRPLRGSPDGSIGQLYPSLPAAPRGPRPDRRPPSPHPGGAFVPPFGAVAPRVRRPGGPRRPRRGTVTFRMSGSTSRGMGGSVG